MQKELIWELQEQQFAQEDQLAADRECFWILFGEAEQLSQFAHELANLKGPERSSWT